MYNMQDNRIYWQGVGATNRRIIYKAAGYVDDDIKHKPHIGIANTYFDGSPVRTSEKFAESVKQGVWMNGECQWSLEHSYMWKYATGSDGLDMNLWQEMCYVIENVVCVHKLMV